MRDTIGHMAGDSPHSSIRGTRCDKVRRAMDVMIVHHRAVLQTAHTHGPPTYALPRLPASSSSLSLYSASVSMVTDGAPVAAEVNGSSCSSSKDLPSGTVPDGAGAGVDHLSGNATRDTSAPSLNVPRTSRGGGRGHAAEGRIG